MGSSSTGGQEQLDCLVCVEIHQYLVAWSAVLSSSAESVVAFALWMLGISLAIAAPAAGVKHSVPHLCPTAVSWTK